MRGMILQDKKGKRMSPKSVPTPDQTVLHYSQPYQCQDFDVDFLELILLFR